MDNTEIKTFISESLDACTNSKGRRYLLKTVSGDSDDKEKALNTIYALHDCCDNNALIKVNVNGQDVEYYFTDYMLPNTKVKQYVESTIVYFSVSCLELTKPIIQSPAVGYDSTKLMTPAQLDNFFTEYYEFKRNDVSLQNISKDKTITLSDLATFQVYRNSSDSNGQKQNRFNSENGDNSLLLTLEHVNNGGIKIPEDICVLEGYTLSFDLIPYVRLVSTVDLSKLRYEFF